MFEFDTDSLTIISDCMGAIIIIELNFEMFLFFSTSVDF